MPVSDYKSWEAELLETGHIVQDNDNSVSPDEAERRFGRYVALVDLVDGTEGQTVATALVRSMQAVHDYEAYQNTMNKLVFLFPPEQVARAILSELPRLILSLQDWAGDLLSLLTQAQGVAQVLTSAFNQALKSCDSSVQRPVVEFIRCQEIEGWLEHKRGVLGV